jgi:hypothetical protein
MSETEIIIKGELHTSRGDLEEEREILRSGVDHLILEGSEEPAPRFKPSQYWFGWILLIFEFLFARHLYVDKTILEDLASVQNVEPQFTRDSSISVLENSRLAVQVFCAILFFSLFTIALTAGLVGNVRGGALWLLTSALLPLVIIRVHESRRASVGRDIQIAEMIEETAQDGGRIVAIVGHGHAESIAGALSSDLPEPEVRPPAYGLLSLSHLKEIVFPVVVFLSVLYVVYSGLLFFVNFVL